MVVTSFNRTRSTVALLILSLFFFSCKTVSYTASPGFSSFKYAEPSDKRKFVMMKDSSIVYGEKVLGWGDGVLNKRQVRIDGKTIPASEVLAFQNSSGYWIKMENDKLALRMVGGRINVYRQTTELSNGGSKSTFFFQKAGGPIREISGNQELKQMLSDCPRAYSMINIPDEEYMKIVKKQRNYLQTIIETYNDCGEWQ